MSSGLGSVFDAVASGEDAPRGPDLCASVEVPRSALGRAEGYVVAVPRTFEIDGTAVARVVDADAPGDGIRLHLAATLPDRATLRLRGQGGVVEGGAPGDLLVTITVVDDPPTRPGARTWIAIAAALVALSAIAWATVGA